MKLVPLRPPGPNARKARAYEADILQLRAQGYTFEAIREALANAGIHVSNSTVQREVARAARRRPTLVSASSGETAKAIPVPQSVPSVPTAPVCNASTSSDVPSDWHSGRDVAEEYARTLITNSFVRAKEKR